MLKISNTTLICFLFIFNFYEISAQVIVSGNPSYSPDPYDALNIDKTKQNIYYQYTYINNPNELTNHSTSLTILQIGTNFSKFVDVYTIKLDSLREKHSKLNKVEKNEMNDLLSFRNRIGFKMMVLKNFKNNNFIVQSRIPSNNYEFEFMQPQMDWKLEQDYKTILGYKTQKATVSYAGRKWIAWFADSIPINLGPYTFGNLPGLILELYDDKRNFHFLANGMNNNKDDIYRRNEKNIVKTSKSNFFKTEKSFHDRPELFFNTENVSGISNFPKIPYNPIELQY